MNLYKYRIFCETEQEWFTDWREEGEPVMNTCPTDASHAVQVSSIGTIEQSKLEEEQRDSEQAIIVRHKTSPTGWTYQAHAVEITTSKLNSIHNKDRFGADFGFATLTLKDASGNTTTDETQAVASWLEWEPKWDYELIAGRIYVRDTVTTDLRLWVVGAPYIPAFAGGSKVMVAGINLDFVDEFQPITTDGRVSKYMTYNSTYHTNMLRFIFKHEAGEQHRLMILMELYKP